MTPSVGIAILTYNSKKHLPHCLPPLMASPLKPKILVIDSSSKDGSKEFAEKLGLETLSIPQSEFNHGRTREMARKLLGTAIVVMITPDAYATDAHMLNELIAPIVAKKASIAYAKQLPHRGANFFESFHRQFNYPDECQLRGLADVPKFGSYTYFCSNSCSAYLNSALDEIGGFSDVLFGEDTVAAAKLINCGHLIAYVSKAKVHHSHSYSLKEEFQRNFDIGIARSGYQHLLKGGSDSKLGRAYVKKLILTLAKSGPKLLPYAACLIGAKWLGYQLGKLCVRAPSKIKKIFSSQKYYW